MAARWTRAELDALRVAGRDYEKFVALSGSTKSYDAFEVKSRRVLRADRPSRLSRLITFFVGFR